MNENESEKKEFEKALFKYGSIASFIERLRAKDTEHGEKKQLIKQILESIKSIPHSHKFKLCRATIYNYVSRFLKGGFESLKRKERTDKGKNRSIPEETLQKAIELKKENPLRSTSKVIRLLKQGFGVELKYGSLHKKFQDIGLNATGFRNASKKPTRHFTREFANELWQSDVKYSLYLFNPYLKRQIQTRLIVFIDKASRIVPHAEFYWRDNLPALENCFVKAIIRRGIPDAVYMDNGSIFRSDYFRAVCAELSCKVIYCQPYAPESKGTVEAFINFVEHDFLIEARKAAIQTLEELNHFFFSWLELEYHNKIHTSLGITPVERYRKDISRIRSVDIDTLHEKFLYREKRKVTSTCLVKIFAREYLVDEKLAKAEVEVRYDYFDQKEIYIYLNGKFMQKATPWQPGKFTGIKHPAEEEKKTKQQLIESARNYLENLASIYQKSLQQENLQGDVKNLPQKKNPAINLPAFVKYLQVCLNPEGDFSEFQLKLIEDYFNKYGPFEKEKIKSALLDCFSRKGKGAHITFYLERIVFYHQKKGESNND
jgi:transposase InsO family protein